MIFTQQPPQQLICHPPVPMILAPTPSFVDVSTGPADTHEVEMQDQTTSNQESVAAHFVSVSAPPPVSAFAKDTAREVERVSAAEELTPSVTVSFVAPFPSSLT
jgi:hypothetical protein